MKINKEKINSLINETLIINIARDLDKIGELLFSLKDKKLYESQINVINQSIELLNQQHQLFTQYQENKC